MRYAVYIVYCNSWLCSGTFDTIERAEKKAAEIQRRRHLETKVVPLSPFT